jgi:hypothetical protein
MDGWYCAVKGGQVMGGVPKGCRVYKLLMSITLLRSVRGYDVRFRYSGRAGTDNGGIGWKKQLKITV